MHYSPHQLKGFAYAPSADRYWQHGHSTESDFIYVTTQSLNAENLPQAPKPVQPSAAQGGLFDTDYAGAAP